MIFNLSGKISQCRLQCTSHGILYKTVNVYLSSNLLHHNFQLFCKLRAFSPSTWFNSLWHVLNVYFHFIETFGVYRKADIIEYYMMNYVYVRFMYAFSCRVCFSAQAQNESGCKSMSCIKTILHHFIPAWKEIRPNNYQ